MKEAITNKILDELEFGQLQDSRFENINLRYRVKNAICLFTNEQEFNDSYLIGHATMWNGKYYLSTFRWISDIQDLKSIYKAIIGKPIEEPI